MGFRIHYTPLMHARQVEYMGWTVTARRDPDDGRVYLVASAEGKETINAVALQGMCGKYATTHWHVGNHGPTYHVPDLHLKVLD